MGQKEQILLEGALANGFLPLRAVFTLDEVAEILRVTQTASRALEASAAAHSNFGG